MFKFIVLAVLIFAVHAKSVQQFSSFDEALEYEKSKYDFEATHMLDLKHFNSFKTEHSKQYATEEEEKKRFGIFRINLLKIKLLNKFDKGSAIYGVNEFADLEKEEFENQYMGLKIDRKTEESRFNFVEAEFDRTKEIPKEFDWRSQGAVTEVKNQQACGSCWAFSAVASIESQNKIVNGKLISLSEQEVVDCDKKSSGCGGGFMTWAYEAIMKLGGLELETDYPYKGRDGECSFKQSLSKVKVKAYTNLTEGNEDEIAQYLSQKGPVSIGINATLMQFYMGGIAHPNFITKWLCDKAALNHGVLIVGYGEGKRWGKREPYWIIKNSWGPGWGRKGYYYIVRGQNACGVAQMASAPILEKQ